MAITPFLNAFLFDMRYISTTYAVPGPIISLAVMFNSRKTRGRRPICLQRLMLIQSPLLNE